MKPLGGTDVLFLEAAQTWEVTTTWISLYGLNVWRVC